MSFDRSQSVWVLGHKYFATLLLELDSSRGVEGVSIL